MTTYLVYGRTDYAEPLTERGAAERLDDVQLEFAGPWVELVAFAAESAHWIIRDGEEAEREAAVRAR